MHSLVDRFRLTGPLVIAPLGGGPTTVDLVVATCNAGALGHLAGAYLSPQQIEESVAEIRKRTQRPFAINLFCPMPLVQVSEEQLTRALLRTRPFRKHMDLPDPVLKAPYHPSFDEQFESMLRAQPHAFSFVFGPLGKEHIQECKKQNIFTIGTATTLSEALTLQETGVDAVVAQGMEAGGHRGSFHAEDKDSGLGTLELTRLISSKLRVPVIAAGGLMNGTHIAQALNAGAAASMLGTAFLLCPEAGTSKPYRSALLEKTKQTKLTRAFSGRLARGIENDFMLDLDKDPTAILPFPVQNAFTRDLRTRGAALNRSECLSLWAGTGFQQLRPMGAAELVKTLLEETVKAHTAS